MNLELTVIGTGSSGNSYLLKNKDGKTVVLDVGIKFETITHNKDFPKFKDIDFVYSSHNHKDHSLSLKNFKLACCDIVSYETLEQKMQHWTKGNWDCISFPVSHNVPNWGLLLKDKTTNETFCYVTDFNSLPKIEGVDFWLFEINYIESIIDKMIEKDKEFKHTNFKFHNSLEYAVEYFNNLKYRPKKIVCCHGSKQHSFKKEVLKQMKGFADEVVVL